MSKKNDLAPTERRINDANKKIHLRDSGRDREISEGEKSESTKISSGSRVSIGENSLIEPRDFRTRDSDKYYRSVTGIWQGASSF